MTIVDTTPKYRSLPGDRSPDDIEREMLALWEKEDLFGKTMAARASAPPFVFHEGPPTANGQPGIHHVFARAIKDLFCRYRTMKGFKVDRKAGWDTHGLPVEIEVEKALKINGKQEIEALGVEKFNQLCRESVWKYRGDWEKLSSRIGYWLDYDDPYVTYTNEYVESVWWALKTLHSKDLLYRGHKILPYCPRCGTALSSHEVAQGYEDVEDPSVYIALDLVSAKDGSPVARRILVWTTTPWTLVSNVALAVHPELGYVELRKREGASNAATIILAEARCTDVLGDGYEERWETVDSFRGSELVGLQYRRPLDWVNYPATGAHEIIVAENFVSADDGTGVVHMAPAFGADDYASGKRNGLAFLQPVDARGLFPEDMPVAGGKFVKDADAGIVEELRRRGVLWKAGKVLHAYPHCWRCSTPLLYYARDSWFVRTTAFRDEMLARNARVDWHPREAGTGRFGEWLRNNIDWAISRDRYWGTPLPIWVCDRDKSHAEAIGSYADLAVKMGAPLPDNFDPHKPYIDGYSWSCAACAKQGARGTMRRVSEVIDAWFDSGSMPFAQWHFPFEHDKEFREHYPADFIAEGVDQTRGWFYSLLAIATGLGEALPRNGHAASGDVAPYRCVVMNDLVLDAAGQKMSKSRGNAVDPWTAIPLHGADAIRLFLLASSQVWVPRRFDENAIRETAGRFLLTLKNVYNGIFAEYANFGWSPSAQDPVAAERPLLDRWILSRLKSVETEVDGHLANYDATLAVRAVLEFVDEDVSRWYVRASRKRFYDVDGDENRAAFATLHEVLTVVCRLLAPFAPFVTDWMHRELDGASVHLASFVRPDGYPRNPELEAAMIEIRILSRLGRAAREEAGVKVRQPLSRLVCVTPMGQQDVVRSLEGLLRDELNIKVIEFVSSAEGLISLAAKPNFRNLGKRFGKRTPEAAAAVSSLSQGSLLAFERGEKVAIAIDGADHVLEADDFELVRRASGDLVVSADGGHVAAIDPVVSRELRAEGLMREVISKVQRMRKEAGLAVSDRIALWVRGHEDVEGAVRTHADHVAAEVLGRAIHVGVEAPADTNAIQTVELDGLSVTIAIRKEQ